MKRIIILIVLMTQFTLSKTVDDLTPEEKQQFVNANNDMIMWNLDKAAPVFQKLIDDGLEDSTAFLALAEAYYKGSGVAHNPNKAVELYKKAYELNNKSYAAFELARIYFDQWEDYKEARKWFEISVAQNSYDKENASFYLGEIYLNGLGVRQDCVKAIEYFESSQDTIFESLTNIGIMYVTGCGVEKDTAKAKEYFGQACDKGDQDGCDEYKKLNMRQ